MNPKASHPSNSDHEPSRSDLDHRPSGSDSPETHPRRFIYVQTAGERDAVYLELPGDKPIDEVIPDLARTLGNFDVDGETPNGYELRTRDGEALRGNFTLREAGIENSDHLTLLQIDPNGNPSEKGRAHIVDQRAQGPEDLSIEMDRVKNPPLYRRVMNLPEGQPQPAEERTGQASLVSPDGVIFVLGKPPVLIGRSSLGFQPDIDLTDLDPESIASRQHAELIIVDRHAYLRPRHTTNGTFINGKEVDPEIRHRLESGDVIRFGIDGVELTYWSEEDDPISGLSSP